MVSRVALHLSVGILKTFSTFGENIKFEDKNDTGEDWKLKFRESYIIDFEWHVHGKLCLSLFLFEVRFRL